MLLDQSFYQLMFFSYLLHKVLKNLVRRTSSLTGIEHSLNYFIITIISQKVTPSCLVTHFTDSYLFSQQLSILCSINFLSQSFLLYLLLLPFLLSIEYIFKERWYPVVRMHLFEIYILFVSWSNLVPSCVIPNIISFQCLSKCLTVFFFSFISLTSLFLSKFIQIVLKCILSFMFIKQSPSRISHKIISDSMHSTTRCQIFIFLKHLQKLIFTNFSLSSLFLITNFLKFSNILKIIFLFIRYFQQLPSVVIFT